jgi:hypothetical protein
MHADMRNLNVLISKLKNENRKRGRRVYTGAARFYPHPPLPPACVIAAYRGRSGQPSPRLGPVGAMHVQTSLALPSISMGCASLAPDALSVGRR